MRRTCACCDNYTLSPAFAFCPACYANFKKDYGEDISAWPEFMQVIIKNEQAEADFQRRGSLRFVSYSTTSEYRPDPEAVTRIATWGKAEIEALFWGKTRQKARQIIADYDRDHPAE